MYGLFLLIDVVCLILLVRAIFGSSRRWLSFGLALLGFALPFALGMGLLFIIKSGVDVIGQAITMGSPIAAVVGAYVPPRRKVVRA
jgi:hypothetical protein